MQLDPAWIALIGTLCGGIGLKILEHWLGKSRVKIDEASKLRDELRIQIDRQDAEIKALEIERDKWRKDYYDLRDQYTTYLVTLEKMRADAVEQAKHPPAAIDPPALG